MPAMSNRKLAAWLETIAAALEANPGSRFIYTTNDDGVWLDYGNGQDDSVNLGFCGENAIEQLRARAVWLRKRSPKKKRKSV